MNNELYHYGILGQKWGRRNGPPYPLSASVKARNGEKGGPGSNRSNSKTNTEKSVKDMTDAELDARIRRLEKERRYEMLLNQPVNNFNNQQIGFGRRLFESSVQAFTSGMVGRVAVPLAVGLSAYGMKSAFAKKYGNEIDPKLITLTDSENPITIDLYDELFKNINTGGGKKKK